MGPVVIGVAGGSGAGKTTIVRGLVRALGEPDVAVIEHDSYYRDQSHLPLEDRRSLNYDHPGAFETPLLIEHLRELRRGRAIEVPTYDFTTHTRAPGTRQVRPARIVIVEGILVLAEEALCRQMDLKVYIDAGADVRLIRRLQRDMVERGRSLDSVLEQYLSTVRPMHLQFVEPCKGRADVVVSGEVDSAASIAALAARIEELVAERR
jgi:uridine kinase